MNLFEFLAWLLLVGGIVFGLWHASGGWLGGLGTFSIYMPLSGILRT